MFKDQSKKIYLSVPHDVSNPYLSDVQTLASNCFTAYLIRQGHQVFSPITYISELRQYGVDCSLETRNDYNSHMLSWADELVLLELEGYKNSIQIQKELELAKSLGKKITRISATQLKQISNEIIFEISYHKIVLSSVDKITEDTFKLSINVRYQLGDTVYIFNDQNVPEPHIVQQISIAQEKNKIQLYYNGFEDYLVFPTYDEARRDFTGGICINSNQSIK